MGPQPTLRKSLCADSLIHAVYKTFAKIRNPRKHSSNTKFSFCDILMSGLAVFGLKSPSLFKFDEKRSDAATVQNLKNL